MIRRVLVCLLLLLTAGFPVVGQAAESFHPGFKTLGVWIPEKNLRLDINIWYPSVRSPFEVNYSPWRFQAARYGKEVSGRFPLLLLSHDSPGTRFSYHETAAHLARSGFVVAAPTHDGDNMDDMSKLFTLAQLTDRVRQLGATLDTVLSHPDIASSIDPNRVGLVGFGAGATATLLMGGALPDGGGWPAYCARAGRTDAYCNEWAAPRMARMVADLPLGYSPADVRVKAVAAVAPGYGMLFTRDSMRYFYPPLLLIRADDDAVNRYPLHADAILAALSRPPQFETLVNADAAALMSACPPELRQDLPELCGATPPEVRSRIHARLDMLLARFFLRTLGDPQNLPQIPAPPDLRPLPPPAPAAVQKNTPRENKKKRRARRDASGAP